jgi:hypothetical protein
MKPALPASSDDRAWASRRSARDGQDGDVISPTDCVRQPFSRSEVGLYKAVVFVNRLNLFWNLGWKAAPEHLTRKEPLDRVDVVIGCVDTRAARAVIRECTSRWSTVSYWLDIGNNADTG